MPSTATITAFYTMVADTRARASQANANWSNFRGHLIPIEPLTIAASDLSHDLGSDEHRWRTAYVNAIDLETATTTSTLTIVGDTAITTGSIKFKIEGTTKAEINTLGIVGSYVNALPNTSLQTSTAYPTIYAQTFTANGSWTAPAWASFAILQGCGGGGGGGGGANTGSLGGGGGGAGSVFRTIVVPVSSGNVLSITVASLGGVAGTTNTDGGTGGTAQITHSAIATTYSFYGGEPGKHGSTSTGGLAGTSHGGMAAGGDGGAAAAGAGAAGKRASGFLGGAGGAVSGSGSGGGGGGGPFGGGGQGGGSTSGAAAGGNQGQAGGGYGAGGGGGGGAASGGTGGGAGGDGIITIIWARPVGG